MEYIDIIDHVYDDIEDLIPNDRLDDKIRNTNCLRLLYTLLHLKKARILHKKCDRFVYPTNLIYEQDIEDLQLQCDVLKLALLVTKNENEIEKIITYLNSQAEYFHNQPQQILKKVVKILNEIILSGNSHTKDVFKKSNHVYIHKFILYVLVHKSNPLRTYILSHVLHNYLNLLDNVNQVDFFNEIFFKCKFNCNLDIICTISNYININLLFISERSVLYEKDFWIYLAESVSCLHNSNLQKQATFLLEKWVVLYNDNHISKAHIPFIAINHMSVQESKKIWQKFFVLLDLSKEKQLHLVQPSLKFLGSIKYLHPLWQKCIYKLLLNHAHNSVTYFSLNYILQENVLYPELFNFFLTAVNNKCNFFHHSNKILEKLPVFCNNLKQNEFLTFLENVLEIKWAPVAMWYFYDSLFCFKLEKKVPSSFFERIYKCILKTPHIYIRNGCAKIFVMYFLNNYDWKDSVDCIVKLLIILKEYDDDLFVKTILSHSMHFIDNLSNMIMDNNTNLCTFKLFIQIIKILKDHLKVNLIKENIEQFGEEYKIIVFANFFNHFCKTDIASKLEQITESLNQDSIDNIIIIVNKLMVCQEFTEIMYSRAISILSQPSDYNHNTIYVAFYIVVCFFKPSGVLKNIVDDWKATKFSKCGNKINENIFILFIELYFLTAEYCDMFFLENILNTQSDLIISKVFEKFFTIITPQSLTDSFSFLKMGVKILPELTKSKHFNTSILHYIKCLFSINWSEYSNEKLDLFKTVTSTLLLLCEIYPTVSYYLSSNIRNFIKHYGCNNNCSNILVPIIVELILKGIMIKKEERVEFDVCQDIYDKLSNVEDNPNIRRLSIKLYSWESMLQIIAKNIDSADKFASSLIDKYKIYYNKRYFPDSQIHLQKLRIIQALLTIYPFLKTQRRPLVDLLMDSFCTEIQQPCVKQLMQWLLFSVIKHENNALALITAKIETTTKTQPSTVVAFILVLLHLTLFKPESFWFSTVEALLPWCMGPHFKLRVYAQVAINTLYKEAQKRSYHEFLLKYNFLEKSVNFIIEASGQAFQDTLKTDELIFYSFNPERDYSLQTIFVDIPQLNNVTETEWQNILDYDFSTHEYIPTLNKDKTFTTSVKESKNIRKSHEGEQLESISDEIDNIQKKITPWKTILEEREERNTTHLGNFILIASLIDKPTNLGGLSRTCEVFGITQLILHDVKTIQDKEFKGLSMTSENWVDIVEVKIANLKKYITEIQTKGYCVVGAEQTSDSISLNNYMFKKKTALLLGNEKTGIPPDLIPMLDACVEIPQFGVVRSLNVHVAGATFIWEYAKQHLVE